MPIRYLSGVNVDSNTLVVDAANDRVGIGTASPAYKLDVVGSFRSNALFTDASANAFWGNGNTATAYGFLTWDTGVAKLYATSGNRLEIGSNGSTVVTLSTTGNVGIGTTAPVSKLQVNHSAAPSFNANGGANALTLVRTGGSGAAGTFGAGLIFSQPYLTDDASIGVGGIYGVKNNSNGTFGGGLAFFAQPNSSSNMFEVMRITSAGNVGIGTTNPLSLLHVYGSNPRNLIQDAGAGYPYIQLNNSSGNFYISIDNSSGSGFGAAYGRYLYSEGAYPMIFTTDSAERLRITGAGNVGIGTTSTFGRLQISGTVGNPDLSSATATGVSLVISNNDTGYGTMFATYGNGNGALQQRRTNTNTYYDFLLQPHGGNVGIGTTSPANTLQIGSVGATGYSGNRLAVGDGTNVVALHPGAVSYLTANGDIVVGAGGNTTNQVYVKSGGNVGIGTTAPGAKLDVSGSILASNDVTLADGVLYISRGAGSAYSTRIQTMYEFPYINSYYDAVGGTSWTGQINFRTSANGSAMNTIMVLQNNGNVGIGTTSPSSRLSVVNSASPYQLSLKSDTTKVWSMGVGVAGYYQEWFLLNDGSADIFRINNAQTQITNGLFVGSNFRIDTNGDAYQPTTGGVALWAATANATYPSYGFYGDTGIGMYRAAADTLAFSTSDTERMRITSDGSVGIGTTSPAYKLDVSGKIYSSTEVQGGTAYMADVSGVSSFGSNTSTRSVRLGRDGTINDIFINGADGYIGMGTNGPTQKLQVNGNIRVTGAYYDSSNSAGSSGQVLSSTGSGTAWVNQGEATATSLFDLLPAARTTYAWSVQLTAGTWADIFSSNTVLSNGTWMVQVYVDDYAVGGQQYQETYSGIMSWGSANTTNQGGAEAISEVVLHRSGHAANAGNFYLRTVERVTSTLLLQGMSNQTYSAASTINFKFVKIF